MQSKGYKIILFFLLVFTVYSFGGNTPEGITVTQQENSYIIDFNLPEYETELLNAEGESYLKLKIEDYGTTSDPGFPALPLISFNLVIPYSQENVDYLITGFNKEEKILSDKLYPFQMPWEKSHSPAERPFTINREYYNTNGTVNPFVQLSAPFIVHGVKGIMITIFPFSYNPLENKLSVIKNGRFIVNMKSGMETNGVNSETYNDFLKSIFVNYNPGFSLRGANYLIITAPEFEAGLSAFVNYKSVNGYTVDIFNTTITGTTTSSIKTFIQNRYNNAATKPEFILLVGDVDKIPVWTGTGAGNPPTDLNYSLLDGTDKYADAFLGRFSVATAQELQNAISKTIYMGDYLATFAKKNIYMASTDNWAITEATHNYVIDTYFGPADYTNLKLYTHTYSATTAQLIAALNDNQLFAIYSGHGATTSWADGPVLNQTQVRALTNTVFPFVYSFACITGDYTYPECFGETWLRTTTGGSSFYGSSVNSYWDEDDILERRLIKAMFEDNITKVTPMFDKGKYYLVNYYGGFTSTVVRYVEMYNLMGDPSLETLRQIPIDTTRPNPVTDLSIVNPTSNTLTLNWTAPYDSTFGGITAYDIRFSTAPINEGNFISAPQRLFGGQSDSAGTPKTFVLDSLNSGILYYTAIKAMDMWGNTSLLSNVPSFSTLGAPQLAVNPDSVNCIMLPDTVENETITISNISSWSSTLDYTVELTNNIFPGDVTAKVIPVLGKRQIKSEKGKEIGGTGSSIKGHGGPDLFGYEWIDSDEPNGPEYIWQDITTTGTLASTWTPTGTFDPKDEGYAGPFNLGFTFKYYDQPFTQVYAESNGFIMFTALSQNAYTNTTIPDVELPNGILAPIWDDLDGKTTGTVHYKAETDKFIIQYTNWNFYSGTGTLTFQVVLFKNGKVRFYYNSMSGTLNGCTVGIENPTGTDGLQVAYSANYLKNNLAVEFAAEPDWLALTNQAGMIYSGNSVDVVLTFNSDGLELGNYSMDMVIHTNDPLNLVKTIPIKMLVTYDVPVELTSFTAEQHTNEVLINWETKTETNNRGFKIERKKQNEKSWTEVSFVNGKGTTTEANSYSYTDKLKLSGKYSYRLVQYDFDGKTSISNELEVDITAPDKFELSQNYPNPFNPSTKINYSLPVESNVKILVINALGERVAELVNGVLDAGYHETVMNGSNLSSGIYFYTIEANPVKGGSTFNSIKKMILIK